MQKKVTTEKGHAFEEKVARWAKRHFNAEVVKPNQFFKGKIAVRPFQVDLVVWTKGDALTSGKVFWIECKGRKTTIKRTDINKFWDSANDVKKAGPGIVLIRFGEKGGEEWDYLIFVSTAMFDVDALNFAKEHNIGCYYYDGRTFQEKNKLSYSWFK